MFYLAGIIITLFLAIILWSKKGKSVADRVLAAWLFVIGSHLFLYYLHITGEIYKHPYLLGVQFPIPLLHGPFLYIYTLTVARERFYFSKIYLLHFLPALLAWVAFSRFYLMPAAEKLAVYRNNGAGYEIYNQVILFAIIISGFSYVLLSFYELSKYRKRIREEFSNTERINLNWLRYLIYGILAIWVILLLKGGDPIVFGAAVVFVCLLGYFGITHLGIFTYRRVIVKERMLSHPVTAQAIASHSENDLETINQVEKPFRTSPDIGTETGDLPAIVEPVLRSKYEKSGLQKEAAEKIHQQLKRLVASQKIFKQEELSLAQLAQQLDVHPNNLSQVINTCEKKSFYDYINTLRIEEFKTLALLPENSRYTLLSLAFECGFNSKTSFNRNFKKITGQSPSAFLKEINVQLKSED